MADWAVRINRPSICGMYRWQPFHTGPHKHHQVVMLLLIPIARLIHHLASTRMHPAAAYTGVAEPLEKALLFAAIVASSLPHN